FFFMNQSNQPSGDTGRSIDAAADSRQDDTPTEFERLGQQPSPSVLVEFWQFLKGSHRWWLLPIVLSLALVGALIALSSSPAAPFIYTLF
ncbi:MAG: DUF5989 family protein, partial [Planctomycetota bacterium]